MTTNQFKKWNLGLGWSAFLISLLTYISTVEPTVSFWDAGEYISTSAKLQVGHPPGAPLFQMIGAVFSSFAFGSEYIGLTINLMSGFASALTILFLFWTITMLLRRILSNYRELPTGSSMAILGSGFVGSLAFAFTDSFWFNAVETEVYAMATLIMAILFWLALLWERDMDNPRGNKWLILIAYITGLSFGVHFMGLLTIPAIGLIYYFKNFKSITRKNFIIANLVAVAVLLFIFKLLLPNVLLFFSATELFFVNDIGMPFNSGSIIAGLILLLLFYYGIQYTRKKYYARLNTLILCILFIFIGFSSWMMLPIRANANVVINENNPSSARELLAYYNLEQYPETHLFYGPQFTDQYSGLDIDEPYVDAKPKYEKDEQLGKYSIVNNWRDANQNSNAKHRSILPRMWSAEHATNYMRYTGYLNFRLKPEYQMESEMHQIIDEFKNEVEAGYVDYEDYHNFLNRFKEYIDVDKPSLLSNITYLLQYQLGYMYWRYFMWNFVGRQDDKQGKMNDHGNWLSGIKFIDEWHLGLAQQNLPSDVLNNKGRNTYYFLPLLLGLLGFTLLLSRDLKLTWVMLVLFLFTGLAIQVYTNVRPFEPRERDYSVVGSFYFFAIWIGFGVYALFELIKEKVSTKNAALLSTLLCLILVPGILIANNWDDHDRSGKYTARSMAYKYLDSCAENAILFSIGDNDTFALWYAQEIEGYRRDVRVVNTSLLQTDWYIDQMKRKAYDSDPIPSGLTHEQYKYGTREYIIKFPITDEVMEIQDFLDFVSSDNPKTKVRFLHQREGEDLAYYPEQYLNSNYFPTEHVRVPVNKEHVLKSGLVKESDADQVVSHIDIRITNSALYKQRLLMLDILANNQWQRPIYFTGGSFGDEDYIWMKNYLQLDGLCYKLIPIKTPLDKSNPYDMGRIDSDLMYDLVKNWDWGNSGSDEIYYDPETRKNAISYRGHMARLIEQLITENKIKKAEEIADLAMEKMPFEHFEYYSLLEPYVTAYFEVGKPKKAKFLYQKLSKKYQEELSYIANLKINDQDAFFEDIYLNIERYKSLIDILNEYDKEYAAKENTTFGDYIDLFSHFYQGIDEGERMPSTQDSLISNLDSVN